MCAVVELALLLSLCYAVILHTTSLCLVYRHAKMPRSGGCYILPQVYPVWQKGYRSVIGARKPFSSKELSCQVGAISVVSRLVQLPIGVIETTLMSSSSIQGPGERL
jgi:hypothetical protein